MKIVSTLQMTKASHMMENTMYVERPACSRMASLYQVPQPMFWQLVALEPMSTSFFTQTDCSSLLALVKTMLKLVYGTARGIATETLSKKYSWTTGLPTLINGSRIPAAI